MKLLDLYCCAGGAAMGYHRAGFDEITGVDIEPQPRYPFTFVQADAIEYVMAHGHEYDAIHASPPCREYSSLKTLVTKVYEKLIPQTRAALVATGKPYALENVMGAKAEMINPFMLCGTMFDLRVIRHRLFECNPPIYFPPATCRHWGKTQPRNDRRGIYKTATLERYSFLTVTGHDFRNADASLAMGIDWMINSELAEAIPPAYTEYIGRHLLEALAEAAP
jgi:DNA (cytosine-5)-methyltransferase 1